MIGRVLVFGVALLALAACGDSTRATGSGGAQDPPPPGDYTATGLPGPFAEGDTLRVMVRDDRVSAQATCNTLSGRAGWSDGVLTLSDAAMTEMGCPGDGHAQDEWLFGFLTSSPAYDVEGDSFTLRRGRTEIRLEPVAG